MPFSAKMCVARNALILNFRKNFFYSFPFFAPSNANYSWWQTASATTNVYISASFFFSFILCSERKCLLRIDYKVSLFQIISSIKPVARKNASAAILTEEEM